MIDILKQQLDEMGYKFLGITFLEDGYEARFRLLELEFEDEVELEQHIEECSDKLCSITAEGFVVSEVLIDNMTYMLTLVPKSMNEMTEFVWKYVEKYGKREDRLIDILRNAFCALEKAIDRISDTDPEKHVAKGNYEKFSNMIF